jgi:tetratricopeptide (TPR) repeat protein
MSTQPRPLSPVHRDVRGVPVSTPDAATVEQLEHAVLGLVGHRADTAQRLQRALASDPGLIPALCMQGFAYKCLARRDFESAAWSSMHAARESLAARGGSERERGLVLALERWCLGDPVAAAGALSNTLAEHPRDLLAFKMHHAINFILGRSELMRDASERAVRAFDAQTPGHGYVLGCHAFSLEETGDLAGAERVGRRAVEREPRDAWGAHAVAHVLETQDRSLEGLSFMDAVAGPLAGCNNFDGHLAWHRSLFLVQLGRLDEALALYDARIAIYLGRDYRDLCNATSLLFRVERAGLTVGDRWERLAELARARMGDHGLAFADAHYVMALAGAGDTGTAARFIASMRLRGRQPDHAARVTAEIGVPVAEGILALAERRARDATRALLPLGRSLQRLGGSNAQRDIFALVLLEAALRGDDTQLAESLLSQRLRARPKNSWALSRLARLPTRQGRAA